MNYRIRGKIDCTYSVECLDHDKESGQGGNFDCQDLCLCKDKLWAKFSSKPNNDSYSTNSDTREKNTLNFSVVNRFTQIRHGFERPFLYISMLGFESIINKR